VEGLVNKVLEGDLDAIVEGLPPRLDGARVLVTGCAGFLGYEVLHLLTERARELGVERVIALDVMTFGRPRWLGELAQRHPSLLQVEAKDVQEIEAVPGAEDVTHVMHMASIASPTFYRKKPIETLDANVWGLRRLLDYYREQNLRGFLFMSTSEIYGDPVAEQIPTPETYRGNVACIGPRACYDESKRLGETLCYLFHKEHGMPTRVVRPFNNYGPGLRLGDLRLPADMASAVLSGRDLVLYSDGRPTRTFCYVSDAVLGFFKVLLHDDFDVFNIGIDRPEISISDVAATYASCGRELLDYAGKVVHEAPAETDYLTDNPSRRCPNIDKARKLLGYDPLIEVEAGVARFLTFLKDGDGW